jgi:hypothetical protein
MMKRRLPILTRLLFLLLIVQSGCVAATEAPLQEPFQQPPTETAATTSDGPPVVQITETGTIPDGTPSPEVTPAVTLTVEETPFVELPPLLVTPPDKPSLTFSDVPGITSATPADVSYGHVIGFIFPDGQVALRLAAVNNPRLINEDLTVVGAVEIGSAFYQVAINLESTDRQVRGRLIAGDGGQDLTFERTALVRNPDRQDSPTFPAISPIISSHGICFVVGQAEVLGKQAQPPIAWSRYCSFTEAGPNEPLLSVRDTYPEQFDALRERMEETRSRLEDAGFPQDVEAEIDTNLTISELEGHPNLNSCNGSNECVADIIGAPSASFWDDYDRAMEAAGGERFAVTVGIVRVERNLEVPDQELVQPGVYWVRVWFDDGDTFMGSTLLGVTDDGQTVLGQTIPSTPAYFLDADNPRTVVSWISAWRLRRWCMWQSNCP